jgi:hypothetical protein
VLLEGEVVHEEHEPQAAPPQSVEHPRELPQILLGKLDESEPPVGVLVQNGLHRRGLAGAGRPVEEGVVRG